MTLQEIFLANPMLLLLTEARKQSSILSMHITGNGMKQAIERMDEFETEQKKNIRQKYSRSNKDIFTRLHRPLDKVFSAAGGSVNINLPDSSLKKFTAYLQNIRNTMSLRKWIQQIALPAFQIDPNGVIFMELDENGNPYPTYRSTSDIFYYQANGRKINLIIFNLSVKQAKEYSLAAPTKINLDRFKTNENNRTKYFRVVDDISDKIVEWDGKEVKEIAELSLLNPFLECPAIIISNIYQFNSDLLLSPDSDIVELANSYLTSGSVFNIWKNLHMFPKHWRMQSICPTCQGNGVVAGVTCTDCNGTKYQKRSSVRDEIIVPAPETTDGKISLPAAFDGYTAPPVEAWNLMTDDLDLLFNQMFETLWGYSPDSKARVKLNPGDKTATQVLDESNSKIQRLYFYSEWAEELEKWIIDKCGIVMFGNSYNGCTVNYGDRYIMEGPDALWKKYSEARTAGSAQAILDDLLQEYYESKYYGNPIGLQIALKQMRLEPWIHLTAKQVQALSATDLDKTCKIYFSEWASTLTDMDWVMNDEKTLRNLLIEYCTPKMQTIKEEAIEPSEKQFDPLTMSRQTSIV